MGMVRSTHGTTFEISPILWRYRQTPLWRVLTSSLAGDGLPRRREDEAVVDLHPDTLILASTDFMYQTSGPGRQGLPERINLTSAHLPGTRNPGLCGLAKVAAERIVWERRR